MLLVVRWGRSDMDMLTVGGGLDILETRYKVLPPGSPRDQYQMALPFWQLSRGRGRMLHASKQGTVDEPGVSAKSQRKDTNKRIFSLPDSLPGHLVALARKILRDALLCLRGETTGLMSRLVEADD